MKTRTMPRIMITICSALFKFIVAENRNSKKLTRVMKPGLNQKEGRNKCGVNKEKILILEKLVGH